MITPLMQMQPGAALTTATIAPVKPVATVELATQSTPPSAPKPEPRKIWLDIAIGAVLAITAAAGTFMLSRELPDVAYDLRNGDTWFQADIGRVYWNTVWRYSDQYRTSVHPLFPLVAHPTFLVVAKLLHLNISQADRATLETPEVITAIRAMGAGLAAVAMAAFFALLRVVGLKRLDTAIFCALAAVSSFGVFWFTVPETYPWGATGILIALLIVAIGCRLKLPLFWSCLASFMTLIFTSTNWMVGGLAMLSRHRFKTAVQWSINVFFIATLLWGVQRAVFRSSKYFLQVGEEKAYVLRNDNGGPLKVARSFFLHTVITPKFVEEADPEEQVLPLVYTTPGKHLLTTQNAGIGSGGVWAMLGTVGWIGLLGVGVWGLITLPNMTALKITLGVSTIGQLALHLLYGEETFLYAAHFGVLLVAIAAMGAQTKLRPIVLWLCGITVICLAVNNLNRFDYAARFLEKTRPIVNATAPIDPTRLLEPSPLK